MTWTTDKRILDFSTTDNGKLVMDWSDDTRRVFDTRPYARGFLAPLSDPSYFEKAYLQNRGSTIAWPDGQDFAPEWLYERPDDLEEREVHLALGTGLRRHARPSLERWDRARVQRMGKCGQRVHREALRPGIPCPSAHLPQQRCRHLARWRAFRGTDALRTLEDRGRRPKRAPNSPLLRSERKA